MAQRTGGTLTAVLLGVAALAAGCANFRHLDHDLSVISALAEVEVTVQQARWSGRPLVLVVVEVPRSPARPPAVVRRWTLEAPGRVRFKLSEGEYLFGVFEDFDGDGRYDLGDEPVGIRGDPGQPVAIGAGPAPYRVGVVVEPEVPQWMRDLTADAGDWEERPSRVEGEVTALSDSRFAPENGRMGMWQPLTFFARFGAGVFMLQPFEEGKTPVLFVHGMSGHPREFTALIEALDRDRFQPWVALYPSGWRISELAEGLESILRSLQARHGFPQMHVVAHSMGGLLARRALALHQQRAQQPFIGRLVTLAAPLNGMASADKGVEMAPSVVPSWRDMGPGSDYVRSLFEAPMPACTRYTLLFAYGGSSRGGASDGVATVASQLRIEAQREAGDEAGFDTTHVGILSDPDAVAFTMQALAGPAEGSCKLAMP